MQSNWSWFGVGSFTVCVLVLKGSELITEFRFILGARGMLLNFEES